MESVRKCAGCAQPLGQVHPNRRWHEDCFRRRHNARTNALLKAKRRSERANRQCEDCRKNIGDLSALAKYCMSCKRRRDYAVTNAWYERRRKPARNCAQCGASLAGRGRQARYCAGCSETRSRDRVNGHRAKRRSQGWGLPSGQVFRATIFARDSFTCHICGLPTSATYSPKDPLSPVIDHLIPLVLPETPGHVWENVACAHKRCNNVKHSRVRQADLELYRRLCRRKDKEA